MACRRSVSRFIALSLMFIPAALGGANVSLADAAADDASVSAVKLQPAAGAETAAPAAAAASIGPSPGNVAALTAKIDEYIAAGWAQNGVEPAPRADDAEFLRRTYLNLVGKIPSVYEVREFLADNSPDKRQRLVDHLLDSPAFVGHLTNIYRALMLPESQSDNQVGFFILGFETWLQEQIVKNVGYDALVRELLSGELVNDPNTAGAGTFFRAKNFKAETLAAGTSRLFLGIRLECAQCHNHPFSHWKQEEFWGLAAFYAGLEGDRFGRVSESKAKAEVKIPETEKTVQAAFLGGETPLWTAQPAPRRVLADWITSAENPYFARTAVNRIWALMMGIGIVTPLDDFDESNPASHPELLDEMARQFAAAGFDVKFVIRAIAASKVYHLTSRQTHAGQEDARLFARMPVQGLSPDQLFQSLAQATGYYESVDPNSGFSPVREESPRGLIGQLFNSSETSPTDSQTTILQALALMNGRFVARQTHPADSFTLAAVVDAPFLDTAGRVEALYLAALSREPRDDERQRMVAYVESRARPEAEPGKPIGKAIHALLPKRDAATLQAAALGDVFWALLNSSEFVLNH